MLGVVFITCCWKRCWRGFKLTSFYSKLCVFHFANQISSFQFRWKYRYEKTNKQKTKQKTPKQNPRKLTCNHPWQWNTWTKQIKKQFSDGRLFIYFNVTTILFALPALNKCAEFKIKRRRYSWNLPGMRCGFIPAHVPMFGACHWEENWWGSRISDVVTTWRLPRNGVVYLRVSNDVRLIQVYSTAQGWCL